MTTVAVLLATYQGERFLEAQMASLVSQDVERLDIIASDDGSTDGTLAILRAWEQRWAKGKFEIVERGGHDFAANFRSMLARTDIDADYVAFADQDDVWDADKLSTAIAALGQEPVLGLYGSRTRLVDAALRPMGFSPLFERPPHFRNAIVQNFAGGNTMVMNRFAHALVSESARRTGFVSHDWWCYLMISGAGGRVIYDPVPHIAYRQHEGNLVGDNTGIVARLHRIGMALGGRFARWSDINVEALERCRPLLDDEAAEILSKFKAVRAERNPVVALKLLRESEIHRQLLGSNVMLAVGAILGKL